MDDPLLIDLQRLGVALSRAIQAHPVQSDVPLAISRTPRRPRKAFSLGVAVGAMALIAGFLVLRLGRGERQQSSPALTGVQTSESLGTWNSGSPPPFSFVGSVRAATTNDGRVIVLNGIPQVENSEAGTGGIYDPSSDTWELIPPAPFHGASDFRLVGDSLLAVNFEARPQQAALFDVKTRQWTAIDLPGSERDAFYIWTWDGETFVVVRTGPDGVSDDPTPRTLRWSKSTGQWSDGTPPPLAPRSIGVSVVSPTQIALIGGFTNELTTPGAVAYPDIPQRRIDAAGNQLQAYFTDSAFYDVTSDSWTLAPPMPPGIDVFLNGALGVFVGNDLYLVSGYSSESTRDTVLLHDGVWVVLPSPTAPGFFEQSSRSNLFVIGTSNQSGPMPTQYLDVGLNQWLDAPAQTLLETERGLIALTATTVNPGDKALGGSVLIDGHWVRLTDAPFKNRAEPLLVPIGDKVVLIGGGEGPDLYRNSDVWILVLSDPPG
jgi:hypothetical protein